MPTQVGDYRVGRVDPIRYTDPPPVRRVNLKASTVFAAGTILGELTGTPGTYATYASGNADGSQLPRVILQWPCQTDASGNITTGTGTQGGEWGETSKSAAVYIPNGAVWNCADIPNLDAGAVTAFGGHLVAGTVTAGEVVL